MKKPVQNIVTKAVTQTDYYQDDSRRKFDDEKLREELLKL